MSNEKGEGGKRRGEAELFGLRLTACRKSAIVSIYQREPTQQTNGAHRSSSDAERKRGWTLPPPLFETTTRSSSFSTTSLSHLALGNHGGHHPQPQACRQDLLAPRL